MINRTFVIVSLALCLGFGLLGTAFAGEGDFKSLLGTDEFSFNTPTTKADLAANQHVYNQQQLAAVGTERGYDQFKFNAPETKADIAARNHVYNKQELASVGTERGYDPIQFGTSESKAQDPMTAKGNKAAPVCVDC